MTKLKVLQVIPSFGMGGAEKVVLNYLKYNHSETMHIKAVSLYPKQGSIYDKEIERGRYDVEYLNKSTGLDFSIVKELKEVIRRYQPDIIHTHLYVLKYLALTGEIKDRKVFHTIHSEPEKDAGRLDSLVNKLLFRRGRVMPITLQDCLAVTVNEYYGVENTQVIRNGIALEEYRKTNEMLKKELGLPNDSFVIGHIGRFSKPKNHEFLITVFKELTQEKENAFLLLIGSGEDEKKIKGMVSELQIADKVMFLGNRSDIPELLNIMDVFFFPSLYEGLGIVLVEAQAAGIPCVVSDKIPNEVLLTTKIEKVSLEAATETWVEKLLQPEKIYNDKSYEPLEQYDVSQAIVNLEKLYRENR